MSLPEQITPYDRMYLALRAVQRPESLTQSSRSGEGPFGEARELRDRAESFLLTWDFNNLLIICVCARMFVDRVHDRAVFKAKDVGKWVAEFREAVRPVLEKESEALQNLLDQEDNKRAREYFKSIKFRLLLCDQLASGNEIGAALAISKNEEREDDLGDLLDIRGGELQPLDEPPTETKTSGEVHAYWEFARFVKHKMLFIIVELRHEAGPFVESTEVHLNLVRKAWLYAVFFKKVTEKARSPLMAESLFGKQVAEACTEIVTDLLEVVKRLDDYWNEIFDVSLGVPSLDPVKDEAVKTELKKVDAQCVKILNKAAQIEQSLGNYATDELKDTWARAFRMAVLTGWRAFPVKLFKEPPSEQNGTETDELFSVLRALDAIDDEHLIRTWLIEVLKRGIRVPEQGLTTELAALDLFRRLLQLDAVGAQQVLWRIMSTAWLSQPLRSSAALVLTGALTAAVAKYAVAEKLGGIAWKPMVRSMLSGEVANGLKEDDRVALAAGFFVTDVISRSDDAATAKTVADDFRELIDATPQAGRRFFPQHVADLLAQHLKVDRHFLKFVALAGVLQADHLLWPDKTPAFGIAKEKRKQWAEIRGPAYSL